MSERVLVELIRRASDARGVVMRTFSDGWVIELEKDGERHRIVGSNFDLNDQASAAIARDKVAASSLLAAAGISHVPHRLVRSRDTNVIDVAILESLHTSDDVVVKPLEGNSGEYVTRTSTTGSAEAIISSSAIAAWAASPFVDILQEARLVVVDGEVWLAYLKTEPVVYDGLKLFNLNKGAKAEPLDVASIPREWSTVVDRTMEVLGLRIAAVDIVVTQNGDVRVLEVNAAFSMTHYAAKNEATFGEVASFYDRLIGYMFTP
jgi:glutathione synthase/RimK-type ligase-like ATP-grasp enzyme